MSPAAIAAAVTTAPRPGMTLLPRCVASLLETGFERPLVFAEPDSPMPAWIGEAAEVVQWRRRLGAWRNWLHALQETLRRRPAAEAVLMVQDDVVFCRRLPEFLEGDLWPSLRCGVVQVSVSRAYRNQPRGLSLLPARSAADLAGAWACLFPRHVAYQVVAHGLTRGWQGHPRLTIHNPVQKCGIDPFIGRTVTGLGYEVWLYNPSLGDHDSDCSCLGHGPSHSGNRNALAFIGQEADPFAVVPAARRRYELPTGRRRIIVNTAAAGDDRLAVVIPMAGECHDLMRSCLGHLARFGGVPLLAVIVDNGTPPGVAEQVRFLAEDLGLPAIQVRNQTNLGFTRAANQGIRAADTTGASGATGHRDVLLLNSDCRVGPNCIPLLVQALARNPKAAAAGPLSLDRGHQSLRHPKRRKQAGLDSLPGDRANSIVWSLAHNTVSDEPMLAFFCTLIRGAALDQVGLFDESPEFAAGLCGDDLWCGVARQRGWQLLLHHGAFADHTHSETFRRLGINRQALHLVALGKLRGKNNKG